MRHLLIFFLAFPLLFLACSSPGKEPLQADAETDTTLQSDDMKAAREAFAAQYPQAEDVSWGEDVNGYYEANFRLSGNKFRADYTKSGKWVETESSLDYKELPEAVKQTIRDRFDKDDITEIERVEHATKGLFFDVEFKDKGKNIDVEIRENGEVM